LAKKITTIKPTYGWKSLNLSEVYSSRDLLIFLVLRDIKAKYAQSVLGILWAFLNPLIQSLVYTVVFGKLAKLDSEGIPYILFSFVAIVAWSYFSNVLTDSTNALTKNKSMLSKVYFPRLILPFSAVFSRLIDFAISIFVMLGLLIFYGFYPQWDVLYFPLLLIILILTALGAGNLLSALSLRYRDVKHVMTFMVRLLMYATPVVYSIKIIPEKFIFIYSLNPMVGVIEGMRSIFINSKAFPWQLIVPGAIVAVLLFTGGTFYFKRTEKHVADIA